ncbi:MAG: hypothetical protein A2Y34_02890 [Spirochaetes bacterium GWC1_27_15]|nr:MAG: hypothetical protein A2Z98_05775 [Spirochaetes bacterium GWB1_27_13]OHD28023.1 MAG: hypothetical protein A2Y34_02890 [Spirochaetes bacterium GWC1_27_15]
MDDQFDFFDTNAYSNDLVENKEVSVIKKEKTDLCEDITSESIPTNLSEIEIQIDRLKQRWSEFTYLIGQRLKFINDNKLYEEKNYPDFKTYVNIALKMSENNAYYYIAIYEFFTEEQTRKAGSKLKLLVPILNKVKRDKEIPKELKDARIKDLRDELVIQIYNKTYREAEKLISNIRTKYFNEIEKINKFERIIAKSDKIIIYENDKDIQEELIKLIEEFYS